MLSILRKLHHTGRIRHLREYRRRIRTASRMSNAEMSQAILGFTRRTQARKFAAAGALDPESLLHHVLLPEVAARLEALGPRETPRDTSVPVHIRALR